MQITTGSIQIGKSASSYLLDRLTTKEIRAATNRTLTIGSLNYSKICFKKLLGLG